MNAVPRLPLKSPGLLHATFVVIYPFQLQLLMHMTMINRKMVYPFPLPFQLDEIFLLTIYFGVSEIKFDLYIENHEGMF